MKAPTLTGSRIVRLLKAAAQARILVVGDVMLDQFIWGTVSRISPEAPVPVLNFESESFMPGGAANVARNLVSLGIPTHILGAVGEDRWGTQLRELLDQQRIGCEGLLDAQSRQTSVKSRVVAHKQQLLRIDRETCEPLEPELTTRLLSVIRRAPADTAAVIVGDYGKGVVTQELLDAIKTYCRGRGIWVSVDPKPVHHLNLQGLSMLTPNRKEAFELADIPDETKNTHPLKDPNLMRVAAKLLVDLSPAVLLITLGELGMLLCERGRPPFHIPTVAQEVFDVSGAGDTVIATFTMAIAAGASPVEAAVVSNHAAGIVVGKLGTATVTPDELIRTFKAG